MSQTLKILGRNLLEIRERIDRSAERSGRKASDVCLIAVTKYHSAEIADQLVQLGIQDIGENRLQVAQPKFELMKTQPQRHFIGPLQKNKASRVLELFDFLHSLDRFSLAVNLQKRLEAMNQVLPVFLQVNMSGEAQKSGFMPEAVLETIKVLAGEAPRLRLLGLMTMAALHPEPEASRPCFQALRQLRDEINQKGFLQEPLLGLSMGMSQDFEVAIEEGASHVRIGSALYQGLPQ